MSASGEIGAIESPCTKVCTLAGETCTGCGRTIDQIVRWAAMGPVERREIMARLTRMRD